LGAHGPAPQLIDASRALVDVDSLDGVLGPN